MQKDDTSGFDRIWVTHFEKMYGPDWRRARRGHKGRCRYCRGLEDTKASQRMRAEVQAAGGRVDNKPECDHES